MFAHFKNTFCALDRFGISKMAEACLVKLGIKLTLCCFVLYAVYPLLEWDFPVFRCVGFNLVFLHAYSVAQKRHIVKP